MDTSVLEKRLARAKAKTEVLEKLIEDKSRELYLAQQQAQSAYDYLDNVVGSMLSCLIVTDDCGIVKRTNRATEVMLGVTAEAPFIGTHLSDVCDEEWARAATPEQIEQAGNLTHEEVSLRRRDGTVITALCSTTILRDEDGSASGIVCTTLDLSERKLLEAQLVQSEKLASIGQMAAGVAHEINNPMGFISSNLGTLGEYVRDLTDLLSSYGQLRKASDADRERITGEVAAMESELDLEFILDDIGKR